MSTTLGVMESTTKEQAAMSHKNRQIVGFSLPPDLAQTVKVEAARRNISLKQLFEELWQLYVKAQKPTRNDPHP